MPSFRPDQTEIMDINRKLEKLLLNSTSDRFALFYASPLSSNLIHQLDLEGAPMMDAIESHTRFTCMVSRCGRIQDVC